MTEKEQKPRRYYEKLSDNSDVENCKQCKDCIFRDDGTVRSNDYRKASCMIYKRNATNKKPMRIIDNNGICEYYNKDE